MAGVKKFKESYLEQNGIDAEEVKDDYDCNPVSHYDNLNGDTITIRDKEGNLYADTNMTKEEFFNTYGDSKEEENKK